MSFSFTVTQGGTSPSSQALSISNAGGGTLSWSATDNATWLTLTPASGSGNGTTALTVAAGNLPVGTHSAMVTVSATGAAPATIPVTFTITAAPVPPAIGMSPTSLSFAAQQGAGNPAAQTLAISNTGGGTLSWSASDDAAWLSPSPASGTGNGTVTISVTTGSLAAGTYNAMVIVSGTGANSVSIPVTFIVAAAPVPPAIGMSPTSLSFTAQQGGSNPASQTLNINNTGGGTLSWSVSDNAAWLNLSPATGTGNGAVTLAAATGSLSAGSYSALVTINGTGASSRTVPVTFTVTAPPAQPTISMSPSALSFNATAGGAGPSNQTIVITNSGTGTLTWSVTDNANWLAATQSGNSVVATVSTTGLAAGSYSGVITIAASGATNTPQTVPVTLTLAAAPPPTTGSVTLTWTANTETDLAGYKVYRATSSGGYGAPIASLPANTTQYLSSGLAQATYFFVITAFDQAGNESPRSAEVSKSIY